MNRDNKERFKHLANVRVNKALKLLKLIGNLANRQNYTYDENEAKKIINALEAELRDLKSRFMSGKNKNEKFKL